MKITGQQVRKTLLQAVAGFLFWTTTLTPYMIFFVDTDWSQYWRWIGMQLLIVPILAPMSVWFINRFVERFQHGA
ncbi:MAG: hypothetical protein U9R74_15625 [Pseudomonadota bacterium]|nr:hypothetical protein [Pseudomonadota bacterium]